MILFGSAKTLKSEKKQNFKKSMKTGEVITAIQDARRWPSFPLAVICLYLWLSYEYIGVVSSNPADSFSFFDKSPPL